VTRNEAAVVVQISSAAKERMNEERIARDGSSADYEPEAPLYFHRPRPKAQQR